MDIIAYRAFAQELEKLGAPNPFKVGPGIFQRFGNDLMQGGKALMSPQLVAPGKFQPAGLVRRVTGEMATSAGKHYSHKGTLMNAVNPLGGAMGGIAEGLTRATGKELSTTGARVGGRMGGALGATGRGLQKAAPVAGMAGEVAGVAGMGTALGAPLSIQGALGGKAIGAALPGVDHALHHAGSYAGHAAHDLAGNVGHGIADKARRAVGLIKRPIQPPKTGYSVMPPPMPAGAH